METTRDLGCPELWQESLERSLARRGKLPRSSVELHRLAPGRDLVGSDRVEESATYWELRRRPFKRAAFPVLGAGGASAVALLAASTLPSLSGLRAAGHGHGEPFALLRDASTRGGVRSGAAVAAALAQLPGGQARSAQMAGWAARTAQVTTMAMGTKSRDAALPSPGQAAAPARPSQGQVAAAARSSKTTGQHHWAAGTPVSRSREALSGTHHRAQAMRAMTMGPIVHTAAAWANIRSATRYVWGGYANPLAGAHLTPERIDQGVDYSGSGPLKALGGGTITYVGTSNTGWPGAFIEYRLAGGRYAGRYVYCAEGVSPVPGLHTGERVRAGQKVAQIIAGWSSGIEIGWGAGIGTETYAMAHRQWGPSADAGNVASQAGKRFSALIASLGGPPGIVEG